MNSAARSKSQSFYVTAQRSVSINYAYANGDNCDVSEDELDVIAKSIHGDNAQSGEFETVTESGESTKMSWKLNKSNRAC